jgi:hypothetical protein
MEADQDLAKVRVAGSNPVVRSKKVLVRAPGGGLGQTGCSTTAPEGRSGRWTCWASARVTLWR